MFFVNILQTGIKACLFLCTVYPQLYI